jgi:hypothetical protein
MFEKKNPKKEKRGGRKKGEKKEKKKTKDNNLSVDFIFPKNEGEKKVEIIIPIIIPIIIIPIIPFIYLFSIKGEKRRMKGKRGKNKK